MTPQSRYRFHARVSRRFRRNIQRTARRKLLQLDAATQLQDLRAPPGKRLESLKGGRIRQHRVRISDQGRICFSWESGAHNVEIVHYH
ncbi:MAG TPA: type II toxin-antitoxin system RelE/ParE family toxin [Candidatus Paceibacterota bacterium]|nr:type II toxin-antitoxin system RelE/ParE family toxin [Candidatus Paceibacterota bacterium]